MTSSEQTKRVTRTLFTTTPANGPDYELGTTFYPPIDVSCQEPFSVNGVGVPAYDASKYVVTLAVICMSGDIVVHAHHVDFRDYEDFAAASASAPREAQASGVSEDLLSLNFGTSETAGGSATAGCSSDGDAPAFLMWSFDSNGTLNSWTSSDPMKTLGGADDARPSKNPKVALAVNMGVRSPLQALESSRRSPVVVGGSRNGKVLFWHSLDLELLAVYDIGTSFAVHALSLSPSDES